MYFDCLTFTRSLDITLGFLCHTEAAAAAAAAALRRLSIYRFIVAKSSQRNTSDAPELSVLVT